MKTNLIRSVLLALTVCLTGLTFFTACEDSITINAGNADKYQEAENVYSYVRSITGARQPSVITLFGEELDSTYVYVELSEKALFNIYIKLETDTAALDRYNRANGTNYEMYPGNYVNFINDGRETIAANESKTEPMEIMIRPWGTVGKTYALPIVATIRHNAVKMSPEGYCIFLIKPQPEKLDSNKGTGIKNILYIEVNDENILNAGEYTMKKSGKPFFDVVNIFAANINYNKETGKAYVHCNENVLHILQNANTYIRPLQAKGIKVVLTILGNHDESGVANLSDKTAADFAKTLKQYVDIYGLDGVDFDDEYSRYNHKNPSPGLVVPSGKALARLCYECRKLMPDKIVSVYDFEQYKPVGPIDGTPVSEIIDYSYWGAYANWNQNGATIMKLDKSQYGPSSFNLNYSDSNGGIYINDAKKLRSEGWGIQMYYNLKAGHYDYSSQFNQLGNILFDDGVLWTGTVYKKGSSIGERNIPDYKAYLGSWSVTPAKGSRVFPSMVPTNKALNIRIIENVAGESYKVYGWGDNTETLPFIMNYTSSGRVAINLPQTVLDESRGGLEWTWVARTNFMPVASTMVKDSIEAVFQGYIDNKGAFTIGVSRTYSSFIQALQPVFDFNSTSAYLQIKGSPNFYYAQEPFTLTK